METLSTHFQPFFDWLLRSTFQASIVVCLILLIQGALRSRLTARWHYALWLILVIRMVLPWAPQSRFSIFNLATLQSKSNTPRYFMSELDAESPSTSGESSPTQQDILRQKQSIQKDGTNVAVTLDVPSRPLAADPTTQPAFRLYGVLPFLWLVGTLLLGGYIIICNLKLWRAACIESPSTDKEILELLEECRSEIGLRTIVALVPSNKVNTPILLGFVRPRLLVPKSITKELTREELRYVLLHELAHVKRHDIALGWLTALLQVLHWFNPLVWLAFHRMRSNRELACDAMVLSHTQGKETQDYGRAIVSLLEHFSIPQPLPGLAGVLESKSQLKRRIAMITQFKKNSYQWSPLAVILIILLACVSLPDAERAKALGGSTLQSAPIVLRRVWSGPDVDILGAPSPDGRYLSYVDWATGDLAIYEIATGKKRRLTNKGSLDESGEYAIFSRWSPDSKQIVYQWCNENELIDLYIIGLDGSKPRILYSNEDGEYAETYDWSPDGRQILACFYRKDGTNQMVLFSAADGSVRVLKILEQGSPVNMSFSPDGNYIVYDFPQKEGSPDRDISLLSIDGSREISLVEHPANDYVLGWAPDGKNILFASDRTGILDGWVIQVADGKPQGVPELVKPNMIVRRFVTMGFTKDGSFYYGCQGGRIRDVYIAKLDPETGEILDPPKKVIKRFEGYNQSPDYSPDGQYLAYISTRGTFGGILNRPRALCIRSLKTGEEREFFPKLGRIDMPRWSPDSRAILFAGRDDNNRWGIYQIDAQRGIVTPVVPPPEDGELLAHECSRDGKVIFYGRRSRTNDLSQIMLREIESGTEKELYRASDDDRFHLSCSPDGKWLAFINSEKGVLRIIPATGGEHRELYRCEQGDHLATLRWTPDGKYILFVIRQPEYNLWRIPIEGGKPEKLGLEMGNLSVHPDGQHIAFYNSTSRLAEVWVMENFLPEASVAKPAPTTTLRMVTDQWKRGYASVSADGKYMTELDSKTDGLVVREIATGKKKVLTEGDIGEDGMYALDSLISPDGQKIAYFWDGSRGSATGLCIIGIDGSGRRLLRQNEYLVPRDWSSDGKQILGILIGGDQNKMVWVSISDGTMNEIKSIGKAYPEKFDISSDGRFIAYDRPQAEDASKRDIFLFDIEQARERRLVGHLDDDKLLGWTPDGKSIFFASDRVGTWDGWLLDVADGMPKGLPRLVQASIGDVIPIGFTQNGDYYFGRYEMRFGVYTAKLNLDTGEILATPSVIRHTGREDLPNWSPDGQYLAYCSRRPSDRSQIICIRSVTSGKERVLDPNLPYFDWLCWCPDSQSLLATSFKETPHLLYRIDAQTGQRRVLLRSETGAICGAELSLDGKRLVYLQGPREGPIDGLLIGRLSVKDLQTDREREILSIKFNYGQPQWTLSPDGVSVAIGLHERGGDILKIISIDDSQTKDLFQSQMNGRIETIAWMPDGNNILYWVDGLWRISAKGGQPLNLRTPEEVEISRHLSVHPDGQCIAFGALGLIDKVWVLENFLPESVAVASE